MLKNQTLFTMNKIKVVTVVGTRPEIIRLSRVIDILDKYTDHILIHTGQNFDYELRDIFFADLSLRKPDYQLNLKTTSTITNIALILNEVDKILRKELPKAFVVLGDTNSSISSYVAKRLKIPIFHIEAGNRCYDQRVPEEINRKIVDHISDVNITYSEIAKQNLIRENIDPDKIFKIGSPLHEVFNFYYPKIKKSEIIKRLNIKKKKYFLLSVHREENVDNEKNIEKLYKLLCKLDGRKSEKIVFSTHPRTKNKLQKFDLNKLSNILFLKPFNYTDYANLQMNAKMVLSDSGSLTEESSIMKFPAINLRSTNERQEGMSFGSAIMTKFDYDKINLLINFFEKNKQINSVNEYYSPNFSVIFFKVLVSYIDYIQEYIWKNN
jgi:UDP-N-acetylglucosamine 2-epimerase